MKNSASPPDFFLNICIAFINKILAVPFYKFTLADFLEISKILSRHLKKL